MNDGTRISSRPTWIGAMTAAATAILVFRLLGGAFLLLDSALAGRPAPARLLLEAADTVQPVVVLILAGLCVLLMQRLTDGRPRWARILILIVVGLLAVFPGGLRVERSLVDYQPSPISEYGPISEEPITMMCRLMDGGSGDSEPVITERNVESAAIYQWDSQTYYVELALDKSGRARMEESTAGAIGRKMGIWMDDVLVATPEIRAPVRHGTVCITGQFSRQEAEAIAARFNARRR